MKKNKQQTNWWIDALLMAGYLFCFYLEFTGVAGHQWLGVALGALAVLHLWLHLDWVKAVTKKLFKKSCARNRWYYLLDGLIVLGFIMILETGLVISTWFDLAVTNYISWLDFHVYASYGTLGLTVVKVGMHWRWVVNITSKIFGSGNNPAKSNNSTPGPVPVPVVPTERQVIDRRHFLAMMGVVSLGSILAVINVTRENNVSSIKSAAASFVEDESVNASSVVDNAELEAQPVEPGATEVSAMSTGEAEAQPTSNPVNAGEVPLTTQQAPAVSACSVLCPKGCSFPGKCRRYTDQNNNGMCDLGECL